MQLMTQSVSWEAESPGHFTDITLTPELGPQEPATIIHGLPAMTAGSTLLKREDEEKQMWEVLALPVEKCSGFWDCMYPEGG